MWDCCPSSLSLNNMCLDAGAAEKMFSSKVGRHTGSDFRTFKSCLEFFLCPFNDKIHSFKHTQIFSSSKYHVNVRITWISRSDGTPV